MGPVLFPDVSLEPKYSAWHPASPQAMFVGCWRNEERVDTMKTI